MEVKRVKPNQIKKPILQASKQAAVANLLKSLSLPDEPKEINTDLGDYIILIYGREKIGKTQVCSSFPDALFFLTEPGGKGLPIFSFNDADGKGPGVNNWDVFRRGVELLESDRSRFKTVIIDTVDRAYDMCLDWVCANRGIEYPGTDSAGDQDFGKSWRAVKQEFLEMIHRIIQSGRGLVFTSHCKESEVKDRLGNKILKIYPSMSNQCRGVVEALVDLFLYCEYVKDDQGKVVRVFICEGDETIWAGVRSTLTDSFPRFLPMLKQDGYEIISSAFRGEYPGLDPVTLTPARQTLGTAKVFLNRERAQRLLAQKGGPRKIG